MPANISRSAIRRSTSRGTEVITLAEVRAGVMTAESFDDLSVPIGELLHFGYNEEGAGAPDGVIDPDYFELVAPTVGPGYAVGKKNIRILVPGLWMATSWAQVNGSATEGKVTLSHSFSGNKWNLGSETAAPFPASAASTKATLTEQFFVREGGATIHLLVANITDAVAQVAYAASLLTLVAAF